MQNMLVCQSKSESGKAQSEGLPKENFAALDAIWRQFGL